MRRPTTGKRAVHVDVGLPQVVSRGDGDSGEELRRESSPVT